MDALIVICIVIIAVVYIILTFYKSQKDEGHGGCGSHKGGCTGCGAHHKGVNSGESKNNSKDMKTNMQVKRKQLKHNVF